MKKTIKFYSKAEIKELTPFINNEQKTSKEALSIFCEKNQRKVDAVRAFIYYKRKNVASKVVKKAVTSAVVTKNEFIIPISKWEIRTENGNNSLVLHFQK